MSAPKETALADRELLELAAKAGGIEIMFIAGDGVHWISDGDHGATGWNPLANDGDAFRLAAFLVLRIQHRPGENRVVNCEVIREWGPTGEQPTRVTVQYAAGEDVCRAMRRAIVLAAAAIGAGGTA